MFPIVEKLGGWAAVETILAKRGVTVTEHARKKWQAKGREQLPRDVAVALGSEASALGITFEPSDFVFTRNAEAAA